MCMPSVHGCASLAHPSRGELCSDLCSYSSPPLLGLQVLDVSNNRISKVEHLQGLTQLEDLWLNDNQIPSLQGLEEALADQRNSLTTIYLENNPAAADKGYKDKVMQLLPNLVQLDANVLPGKEAL